MLKRPPNVPRTKRARQEAVASCAKELRRTERNGESDMCHRNCDGVKLPAQRVQYRKSQCSWAAFVDWSKIGRMRIQL